MAAVALDVLPAAVGFDRQPPLPPSLGPINWPMATAAFFGGVWTVLYIFGSLFGWPVWWIMHRIGWRTPVHGALAGSAIALLLTGLVQLSVLGPQARVADAAGRVLVSNHSLTRIGSFIVLERLLSAGAIGAAGGFATFSFAYTSDSSPSTSRRRDETVR